MMNLMLILRSVAKGEGVEMLFMMLGMIPYAKSALMMTFNASWLSFIKSSRK